MKPRETIDRLGRLQRSVGFRVVASIIVLTLAVSLLVAYAVAQASEGSAIFTQDRQESYTRALAELDAQDTGESEEVAQQIEAMRRNLEAERALLSNLAEFETGWEEVAIGTGVATILLLGAIWLGLGLTTLGVLAVAGGVALPLALFGRSLPAWLGGGPEGTATGAGLFIGSVCVLSLSFSILMQLLKAVLDGKGGVFAIARNVLMEAVRMKVSLVFIVLLIFGLAALPGLLNDDNPLRYRVQAFLQYGLAGAYWLTAILVLFLAVGTLAFEQRDRVIWQTMTKPVSAWSYVLGKWLGVMAVATALLGVSSVGLFVATDYLARQPAEGEARPFQTFDGSVSEDRRILHTQVLVARDTVYPEMIELDPEALAQRVNVRVEQILAERPGSIITEELRTEIAEDIQNEYETSRMTVPGSPDGFVVMQRRFVFTGLEPALDLNTPLTLRYKVNVGGNDPRERIRLTFITGPGVVRQSESPLGQPINLMISPAEIEEDGRLFLQIVNGYQTNTGFFGNPETLSFPPDGLEISYPVGTFSGNYARVLVVLWCKIALLAVIAIWSGTFLSFPVACLVAFSVFLLAEGSGFLADAAYQFGTVDQQGNVQWWKVPVYYFTSFISWVFRFYSDLRPTSDLVQGKMVPWSSVLGGLGVVAVVSSLLYLTAASIFRKRELAIYSGS